MIYRDEIIEDALGANAFLMKYFDTKDLTNEVAYQILAQLEYEGLHIWDMA